MNTFNSEPNEKRLSPEEWKALKDEERDNLYKIIDNTLKLLVEHPEKFREFLDLESRLDKYSVANSILIYSQFPNASNVKDFNDWAKQNITIKKGEKGFSILEPLEYEKKDGTKAYSYKVKKVFDISQTSEGEKEQEKHNIEAYKLVTALINSSPIEIKTAEDFTFVNKEAEYVPNEKVLYVKKHIGDSNIAFKCLTEELAQGEFHNYCKDYNRDNMEFNGICVSYILCKKYGIDTSRFNFNDIPESWKGMTSKDIRMELNMIRSSEMQINNRLTENLFPKKFKEKSMER